MSMTEMPQQGEPWFDDGNLILQADGNVCFKIHRGVLARQSEIFKDMLALPQPSPLTSNDVEKVETVRMYDLPVELSNLLMAIYDGVTFYNRDVEDFFFLASILRLSTKYFIAHLRKQAIEALAQTWSYMLDGHDAMVDRALQAPVGPGEFTYPYVHPVHVLNLARETNVCIVIPSAIYFLSVYPFSDLLQGSHPKLLVESRTGLPKPASTLSIEDITNYTHMYQHRIELVLDYVRHFCGERRSHRDCRWRREEDPSRPFNHDQDRPPEVEGLDPCSHTFARLASRASRSWYTRTGPLRWMLQTVQYLEQRDMPLCSLCKYTFQRDVESHRHGIWDKLPGVVGLPRWKELLESDLPETCQEPERVGTQKQQQNRTTTPLARSS
ncbi:uncharacterized protein FOMMEDRAFT_143417 [Fomitiporia mediterranea MF3/22]|uniref:uncharacterized protein n=1 Tax=Fomitiporia mediterranea (strain MF3/22) TaxID=694068 RepID=UPI0004408157|nr:uncharacterized protein FOMMEDRAFT_143417 [Fomitiporia mediterranea MF3/22]EJC97882.1 hypothetical protein FOMMEDRAFT_143417 [Fomitiporia mediterranea MF3/22]